MQSRKVITMSAAKSVVKPGLESAKLFIFLKSMAIPEARVRRDPCSYLKVLNATWDFAPPSKGSMMAIDCGGSSDRSDGVQAIEVVVGVLVGANVAVGVPVGVGVAVGAGAAVGAGVVVSVGVNVAVGADSEGQI